MNFFESLIEQPSFHRLGLTLLHFVWQGVAVGALSGLALFLLRSDSEIRVIEFQNQRSTNYLILL